MTNNNEIEFGTFKKDVLSQKIATRLLNLIRDKRLVPGNRLPPERELAAMMQVSRPSLREALRALSIMGVIQNKQGSGTYVTSLKPSRLVEHLDLILSIDDSFFLDLFEARRILEVGVARLASINITDEEIDKLEEILQISERNIENPEGIMQADVELHKLLAEATHNKILSIFLHSINDLSSYSRQRTQEIPKIGINTLESHRKIVQAVKERNQNMAALSMLEHLNEVEERLKKTEETNNDIPL
jgi:GntR family transcriptional repressor for pyruvate dehydrogenase complex